MIGTNESNWATEDSMKKFRLQAMAMLEELKARELTMTRLVTRVDNRTFTEQWRSK